MKRITQKQAKNLVPCEDDLTNSERAFFTLTKDPLDPEWENVTYYTARKENIYENRDGEGDSWVYILTNPSMPNLVKIGHTKKEPDIRAKQVSRGTGVPTNFRVEFAFRCFNAESLEREIHKYLKPYRVNNNKEFFQIAIKEAENTIELLGQRYL